MTGFAAEPSVLSSPVCSEIITKYGHFSRISREIEAAFLCANLSPARIPCIHPDVRRVFLLSTFARALPSSPGSSASPTDEQIARASVSLAPYLDAYVEYIHGCATSFAPQANDFGDSECFVYLQDQNKLVTREKRWNTIAKQVCPTHYFEE
jgi:hypothetical protein